MPKVHLISYATPRFRFRQQLLHLSARWNGVADGGHAWTLAELRGSHFPELAPRLGLDERGSGFWAWKPFIICEALAAVPDGDIVFYCDVGRLYPFKLLDQPVDPYLGWMDRHRQDFMPGLEIPWDGNVAAWTRRGVLREFAMDRPEIHAAWPIQASFSIWRAGPASRRFAAEWRDLCARRELVSDDPDGPEIPALPGFRAHRHDQALLTLLCLREGIHPLSTGATAPDYDSRHPSMVSRDFAGEVRGHPTPRGRLLRRAADAIAHAERQARKCVKFGKPIHD